MMQNSAQIRFAASEAPISMSSFVEPTLEVLTNTDRDEILSFLRERPIHTAYLTGLIDDNGVESKLNRGVFFGCRNYFGQLEGVALIGHAIVTETASDRALKAFAQKAQNHKTAHLIMCEENLIDKFWAYYTQDGQDMRKVCRELLFELKWPIEVSNTVPELRQATAEDIDVLVPVHAELALQESGIDPRDHDLKGFVERYHRRISQGRTWILKRGDELIFKADVVSETSDVAYLEGIWVNPTARSQGLGRQCMAQLARTLLRNSDSICLFVNDENDQALNFYRQCGYHMRATYDTIFLK